jgi:hypothetical protein
MLALMISAVIVGGLALGGAVVNVCRHLNGNPQW